jgi:hypothetical protein
MTNIDHNDWAVYGSDGYIQTRGVQVRDLPAGDEDCATVRIGATIHRRDDLRVSDDGRRIESIVAGWYLTR